jgi:hypothetical protein
MKQTAVEWLVEQISKEEITFTGLRAYIKFPELIQQAKEMEKEQIIDACKQCSYSYEEAEQYYNETFKSE